MSGPLAQVSGSSAVAASQPFSGGHSAVEGTEAVVAAVAATTFASAPASPPAGGAGRVPGALEDSPSVALLGAGGGAAAVAAAVLSSEPVFPPAGGAGRVDEALEDDPSVAPIGAGGGAAAVVVDEAAKLAHFEEVQAAVREAFCRGDFDSAIDQARTCDLPDFLHSILGYAIGSPHTGPGVLAKKAGWLVELREGDAMAAVNCLSLSLDRRGIDYHELYGQIIGNWPLAVSQWLLSHTDSGEALDDCLRILEGNTFNLESELVLAVVEGKMQLIETSGMRERAHALVAAQPESDRRTELLGRLS